MPIAEYLRRQAETCLRIARTCFDLASAERMRLLANELKAKAHKIEQLKDVQPHRIDWDVRSSSQNSN